MSSYAADWALAADSVNTGHAGTLTKQLVEANTCEIIDLILATGVMSAPPEGPTSAATRHHNSIVYKGRVLINAVTGKVAPGAKASLTHGRCGAILRS